MPKESMRLLTFAVAAMLCQVATAWAGDFEGLIQAMVTRDGQRVALLYSVGTHCLRVENTATNQPNTVYLLDRDTGGLTLLFANNHSFLHLPPAVAVSPAPGTLPTPAPVPPPMRPTGIGPAGSTPGMPAMPSISGGGMPAMPMMPVENPTLRATGETTNLLGYPCSGYELKQRGETMMIWATDKLAPFQAWRQNQPPRFGPRTIEDQWADRLKAKKLFPLQATLRFDQGPEHYRFEVKNITPKKFTPAEAARFKPPPDYREIEPLPF